MGTKDDRELTFYDPKLPQANFLELNPRSDVNKLMGPRPDPALP